MLEQDNDKIQFYDYLTKIIGFAFWPKTVAQAINFIAFIIFITYILFFASNWSGIINLVRNHNNIAIVEYFVPMFFLPIALFGFWRIKSYGWIFLALILTYFILLFSRIIFIYLFRLNFLPLVEFFGFLFAVITMFFINSKRLKDKYHISNLTQLLTIGFTVIVVLSFWVIKK